ncbi:MAG: hypothetical protein WB987_18590 [Candidatus Acidiferrales bacterium]
MRDKNYNTGVRGVLLDSGHYVKMGSAIWLYSWLVLRQTHQSGSIGWVLGGAPVSYREIEEETGFNRRTLEGWFRKLRRGGYIETTAASGGVVIRIMKAKKFTQTPRRSAWSPRESAGASTQICVPIGLQNPSTEQVPDRMGSSSVARIKDRTITSTIHRHFHKEFHSQRQRRLQRSSGLEETPKTNSTDCITDEEIEDRPYAEEQSFSYEVRDLQRLLRRERQEAVQRELRVGTGPEVRR